MKKTNKENGVTLAALTVTIIVLLILAGVTIVATVGNDGVITRVQDTAKKSFNSNVTDALMTIQTSYTSISEYMTYLKENEYLNNNNVVNLKKLLQLGKVDYGNGKDNKDVYKLDYDGNTILILNYYNQKGEQEKIADMGLTMEK